MSKRIRVVLAVLCLFLVCASSFGAFTSFITVSNGYFYDSATVKPWTPKGIAYQTWNRPLGVWQTQSQIVYDLDEMVKMGVDSIRIDMVWQHIEETADDQFSWSNYDFLFQECDKRNIRIFALIGYQWPPSWFPDAWYTMHPPGSDSLGVYHTNRWQSDIINYENLSARAQYSNFIYRLCQRYKDTKAVAGWIVGNEYGYLGLWSLKYDGYDPDCEQAFRNWCTTKYGTIASVNAAWGTALTNFNQIVLVDEYSWKGTKGAEWADMVQWHEDSIANFTALGARAARSADTNHLLSYATVGMQWGEEDWRYHAEDRGKITQSCASNNAPLAFFSVNNYPWALDGSETRNGRWGVFFTKKVSGLPVLYTETGFTSSETLFPGVTEERQGILIRNSIWEGMEAGAVGMHIFTWQDRPWISDREKGFGILYGNRGIKPAFWTCSDAYALMNQAKLNERLGGSKDRKPDVAFLWTAANDSQYIRYENEMQHEAGALERLGYEPSFINLSELASGAYTNYRVLILPRNMRVDAQVPGYTNSVLNYLLKVVIPAGVHVLAVADLPGQQDFYGWSRAACTNELRELFGVAVSDVGGFQPKGAMSDSIMWNYYSTIDVKYNTNGPASIANYAYSPGVWKYNDRVRVADGTLWASMNTRKNRGFESSSTNLDSWGTWGSWEIRNWFPYEGTNMLRLWGSSGAWQNNSDVIPGERYSARAVLRNNSDDPLRGGEFGQVSLEWYDANDALIGSVGSAKLTGPTPGNSWVEYVAEGVAPSNASYCRTILRTDVDAAPDLLVNGALSGTNDAPTGWSQWNSGNHDPDTGTYRSSPNSWNFWYEGGIYQDVAVGSGFIGGDTLTFGGYLYTPSGDALRNGTKYGIIQLECWNGGSLLTTYSASPTISSNSAKDTWVYASASGSIPTNTTFVRLVVRCNDATSGDGTFRADDVTLKVQSPNGSCYFDGDTWVPAVVAKNQGTAKAVIVLHSLDVYTDTDGDNEPNSAPWQWRSDILGAIVKDYFGVQPAVSLSGTNYYMCLPEYRTCADSSTLWQVKSYAYNWHITNGGDPQTFTMTSSLLTGKTVRAFQSGQILTTNCSGTLSLTLPPDGQEILLAYGATTNAKQIVQIANAPSVVHPMGDKAYSVTVKYDCQGLTDLVVKAAFKETGDNGDGVTNEVYVAGTNVASGASSQQFYLWIPPYKQSDSDYKSTPDGGKYEFVAWLERTNGTHAADAVPVSTRLEWGVRPTSSTPTNMAPGSSYSLPTEWEDLYEPLPWQLTPVTRNDQFPSRVALFRSSKTESQFPGQFAKANTAADWLESMGYTAGNLLDLCFDNVVVSNGTLFTDNFEDGDYAGWTRDAGCANWAVQTLPLSQGQALRYDRYTTYSLNTSTQRVSYRVTADANKTIDHVFVYACRVGTSPTYTLSLYGDKDGLPTGNAVFSQTFTAPTTSYTWVDVDVSNFTWSAGATYHLLMAYASGTVDTGNHVRLQYVGMNTANNRILYSSNGGTSWTTNYTYDPSFRILYSDGTSYAQPYISYSALGILGATRYGQQFRLPESVYVSNVAFVLYKATNVGGDVSLLIRRWSDKAVLATATVSRTAVSTTNNWVTFAYSPAVLLGGSTQYFFDVLNLGATNSYYVIRENSAGGYGAYSWDLTSNACVYSSNTGVSWTAQTDYDFGYVLSGYTSNRVLRAWRIGNSDNLLKYSGTYTNVSLSANIRYNKQDTYFSDAEIYVHYKDRANYYRVAIENYYGFWRLKYVVLANSNVVSQGWLYDFVKTNRPVENTWYNLKVVAAGPTNTVYFNGAFASQFVATNVPSGGVAVGSRASQLGTWEPQKGYYFIDDDEWSFWAPEGQSQVSGHPLNLDWGYLKLFFNTLVLPSTYVMSDIEVLNLHTWLTNGLNSVIAMDGGVAMKDETGSYDLGRIEPYLGVNTSLRNMSTLSGVTVQPVEHYVTLDYAPGAIVSATGTAVAYDSVSGNGTILGVQYNATSSAPAWVANMLYDNPLAPAKTFTFNSGVDSLGQLTNQMKQIAQRAFEWARGNAFKCKVELKYSNNSTSPYAAFTVWSSNFWILGGSGSNSFSFTLPSDGIMTGTNLVWSYTIYPWDATNFWIQNQGFYSSALDAKTVKVSGKGIQLSGAPEKIFAGRNWETWTAFNSEGTQCVMTIGIKDRGALTFEDNFGDGDTAGWTIDTNANVSWSVATGALKAAVVSTGGYANIHVDSIGVQNTNLTFEYYVRFGGGADDGGVYYRGYRLYVNPAQCGWGDLNPQYYTNTWITSGWNQVVVNLRDTDPYVRSDLAINGKTVFLDEPVEVNSLLTNGIGFVSPSRTGTVEWDNVRIADEHYEFYSQDVNGQGGPVQTMITVPDYDPFKTDHAGTSAGAQYEWYAYLSGFGAHCYRTTAVYFAPRLVIEDTNFPFVMNPGTTVSVPVEWESLPTVPMKLQIQLKDGWKGVTWITNTFDITTNTGLAFFPVDIPSTLPPGGGYCWFAMVFPSDSPDPMLERLGADDTFRYGRDGMPVEPEQPVSVTPLVGPDYRVFRDAGIPPGTDVGTWQGGTATFNGKYVTNNAPEGSETFLTECASWAGWGVISTTAVNMAEYENGYISFWMRSTLIIKMDIEDWSGVKGTKYIPSTTNTWKLYYIPVSDIKAAGVNLSQIKGLFEITAESATRFEVDDVRWTKGVLNIYNDAGFLTNNTLSTWGAGSTYFNPDYTTGAPPEGVKCFLATGSSAIAWGTYQSGGTVDLSRYSNGFLQAWIRSATSLTLKIEGPSGTVRSVTSPSTTGMWSKVRIPMTSFSGINFRQIYSAFGVTQAVAGTFCIDDVQWIFGTNTLPSDACMVLYNDLGIPGGTDVQAWWSQWWLVYVSPYDGWVSEWRNGGFETIGSGIPSWSALANGVGATAYVTTAAAYTGSRGLRVQTGSAATDTAAIVYQEFSAGEGDTFWADAMIRQPTGTAWVAGTTARVEVEFQNVLHQTLTNFVALTGAVTSAGQTWSRCNNLTSPTDSNATGPRDTAYARIKLVINKPASAGASVADFDCAYFCQRSSFNGSYARDPLTPEGLKCFRTFSAGWAGWGIVSTNGVVDISSYTNGYLKFWFKAPQVSLWDLIFNWYYGIWDVGYNVQMQSAWNGVTNTVSYYEVHGLTTTNGLQWYQVSIPVNAFTSQGVDAQHVRCPFMLTASMTTAWYVDFVRFEMTP